MSETRFKILGAGMSGLLASAMLQGEVDAVYEKADRLPNNHHAVLRFRSRAVADALNIPFREVKAVKSVLSMGNPIADALAYSLKTNGTATSRSILSARGEPMTRYIAPPDLVSRMANKSPSDIFQYGVDALEMIEPSSRYISTLPMTKHIEFFGWPDHLGPKPEFRSRPGAMIKADLGAAVDAYCSLYVPDPSIFVSRISLTGSELCIECYGAGAFDFFSGDNELPVHEAMKMDITDLCLDHLGLGSLLSARELPAVEIKVMPYAKILPIPEEQRKRYVMWLSDNFKFHSLGRFATWRPSLLMDDVVNDVRVIHRIAHEGHSYNTRL